MANRNGLALPQAYAAPNKPFYLDAAEQIVEPTLVSPITLQGNAAEGALAVPAEINVPGAAHATPAYVGAIKLQPGGNVASPDGAAGVVIRAADVGGAGEPSTVMEVGTDGEGPNQVLIAGALGLSEVYNPFYNPAVSLKEISLSATNPLCEPDPANTGEIFRCAQAGVAAAAIAAIGTNFAVPESGWYALQIEVELGNAPAPAAPTINVPITVAPGGVNLGENLSFAIAQGVVIEPYGLMEVVSNEFAVSEILVQNSIVVRTYTSMHYFDTDNTYTFTLRASSPVWNIGAAGQIKAELIAMV